MDCMKKDREKCTYAMETEKGDSHPHTNLWLQKHGYGIRVEWTRQGATDSTEHEERQDQAKYRGCVAQDRIEPGRVVLACTPAAFALSPVLNKERCAWCFRTTDQHPEAADEPSLVDTLLRCAQCKETTYCSRQCQSLDWKAGHRCECKKLYPRIPNEDALCDGGKPLQYTIKEHIPVYNHSMQDVKLMEKGHVQMKHYNPDLANSHESLAAFLSPILGTPLNDLLETLNAFCRNNFGIAGPQLSSLGAGCYPIGSLMNHRCTPNCITAFNTPGDHTLYVRTIRPIEPGEELTLCYIDVAQPASTRKRELLSHFCFHCQCDMCAMAGSRKSMESTLDGRSPADYTDRENQCLEHVDDVLNLTETLPCSESRITLQQNALEELIKHFHPYHWKIVLLRNLLMSDYIASAKPEDALAQGRLLVKAQQYIYGENHPVVAKSLRQCKKLSQVCEK